MCAGQNCRYGRKQCVVDLDRVVVNVEVTDRCAAKADIERERVLPAVAENRYIAADIGEHIVLRSTIYDRSTGTDKGNGQRLIPGGDATVVDLCIEGDAQRVSMLQKIKVRIGRIVGPMQYVQSAGGYRCIERHSARINQRSNIRVRRQGR